MGASLTGTLARLAPDHASHAHAVTDASDGSVIVRCACGVAPMTFTREQQVEPEPEPKPAHAPRRRPVAADDDDGA